MANNWEDFKNKHSKQKAEDTYFWLSKVVEKSIESPIERVMYVVLYEEFTWAISQGRSKLERQKKIGKYTVDFYLSYLSDLGELVQFIIECDGHDYHERTKEQAAHDKKRDRYFTENGYIVLRYTGSEIYKNYQEITKPIYSIIVKKDGVVGCG